MELLDSRPLVSMICHEENGAGLIVFEADGAELRVESDDLDTREALLFRKGRVSVVPDVELSVGVGFGGFNEVTLPLVRLAWRGSRSS